MIARFTPNPSAGDPPPEPVRLDMLIAFALVAVGWLAAAALGFMLLDPDSNAEARLTALAISASYQLGGFLLAGAGRRAPPRERVRPKWLAPALREGEHRAAGP